MKINKFLSIFLLLTLISTVIAPIGAQALDEPTTGSDAIILVDTVSGTALYEKNADTKVYPASTTKIMTVLLGVEAVEMGEVSLGDYVTASENCDYDMIEDGSSAGIVPGESMTFENLMYCAMVSSANEACNIIAEHVSGNIPDFIERMNTRAKELGCANTYFDNTHGLPDEAHYTTARDFSIIAQEAITHPLFMQICNTPNITIPATNVSPERVLSNTNALINPNSVYYPGYYYEPAAGIKTGHTEAAGYCLVSTATKNGMTLLCVVMGGKAHVGETSVSYDNFGDSVTLYNWAFDNWSYRDILKITDLVQDVPVKMGSEGSVVSLHPQTAVKALMPNDEDISSYEQKVTVFNADSNGMLMAPVEAGEVLGEITIEKDGKVYGSSQLVASSSVDLSYGKYIAQKIGSTLKKPLVIVAIVVVLGLAGLYVYSVIRYQKEKKQRLLAAARGRSASARMKAQPQPEPQQPAAAPRRHHTHASAPQEEVYPDDDGKPDMGYGDIDLSQPAETQAERDYFAEFFGKK